VSKRAGTLGPVDNALGVEEHVGDPVLWTISTPAAPTMWPAEWKVNSISVAGAGNFFGLLNWCGNIRGATGRSRRA